MKKIETYGGQVIYKVIAEAIRQAGEISEPVEFDFNGVTVQVAGDSNPNAILRDWRRGLLRPSGTFTVTPYPPVELSQEQLSEDARLEREREERQRAYQIEAANAQEKRTALLKGALSVAPPLALADADGWQRTVDANQDAYGGGVVRFAEHWARLMQGEIDRGAKLEDIAGECCSIADDEGITGFMYGAAVSILSQVWIHGEALRRWHNLKTQIGNEGERANETGGTLNPALLSIG
jgi:hypothetical protein